jgi:hypothetical protein
MSNRQVDVNEGAVSKPSFIETGRPLDRCILPYSPNFALFSSMDSLNLSAKSKAVSSFDRLPSETRSS